MALASLRYRKESGEASRIADPRHAAYNYDGSAADFFDWQFQVEMRLASMKEADRVAVAAKIIDGLRGEACIIAMEIGSETLLSEKGIELFIATIKDRLFPIREVEARELFRQGQKPGGPLSRATGEPMLS
jgi:hypothetical protein